MRTGNVLKGLHMANPEKCECIIVIGQKTDDGTYSWMISLLDYDKVKAVTVFNFKDSSVTLHEAGGSHHLEKLEEMMKKPDRDLMVILLYNYLITCRQDIYGTIFPGESLPPVTFISISSHSFMTGLSPRYETPDGICSETFHLTTWEFMVSKRDAIREMLSPECVVKLWGCQGIEGKDLPARATRACLQLDWDEKQGNKKYFHPLLYSPSPPPLDDPKYSEYEPPTFYAMMRRNRRKIDESIREEFDYLTARNIIKCIFLGDNPPLLVPAEKNTAGTLLEKEKHVEAGYMREQSFYPVALSIFLNRPVIASRFGLGTKKHSIPQGKFALLKVIRDGNKCKAFPGLSVYFDGADEEITMPVNVECVVLDLLVSLDVTPPENTLVPPVLLSGEFPSERYVVYRPDISLSNVEFGGVTMAPEKPPVLDYSGKAPDLLETAHLLTYPSIKDYS